jgi:tetratricopeptide (TPR) repeat protein
MDVKKKSRIVINSLVVLSLALLGNTPSWAQIHTPFLSHNNWLNNAEQQYRQQLYAASYFSAHQYLLQKDVLCVRLDPIVQQDKAGYLGLVSSIAQGKNPTVMETIHPAYAERAAFATAKHHFNKGNWALAIDAYKKAGIANLSNQEIAAAKFELAYCYFNNKQFRESKALLLAIKDLEGPYAPAAHYYFGLLAYNEGDYKNALASFQKIELLKQYKNVVPYYIAEILYFDGQRAQSFQKAKGIIAQSEKSYYFNESYLLAAQCLFEGAEYAMAIPYFEFYYQNVSKIRKQDLYKMGYCYYRTQQWQKAIEPFQQLSTVQDNLGQDAMYLLGDCYLKTNDKKGAKNAFSICSEMPFNEGLIQSSLLVSAKLAFELGYSNEGSAQLQKLLKEYPTSSYKSEATNLLSEQLFKDGNYSESYQLFHQSEGVSKSLMQKITYCFAMQNMQQNNWFAAEKLLNESIEKDENIAYTAAAYFWKTEIDYRNKNYTAALANATAFMAKNNPQVAVISASATAQNALMTMGYAALNKQDFAQAREYFAQAQRKQSHQNYSATRSADAAMREADAAFLEKDYVKASELYTKAMGQNSRDADYARFQKSTLLGLQGKPAEQADMLLEIIAQKNPSSKYQYEAHYALGDLHLDANKYEDAINHFQKINDQTAKHLAISALMKIGFAYQEADNVAKSIESYKKVVQNYPNAEQKYAALEALKNLFVSSNKPKEYLQFLKDNNLAATDKAAVDSLFYAAAETQYAAGKYDKATEAMSSYLQQYPQGIFYTKANFYKAESHYQLKQFDSAIIGYDAVLMQPWSDFTEPSALKASALALAQNNHVGAEKYYGLLRNNAMSKENLKWAYKGLMTATKNQSKYDLSNSFADTLLTLPELDEQSKNEALLVKAAVLFQGKKYNEATVIYDQLAEAKNIEIAAESQYTLAQILLVQNKLNAAETAANKAIQQTTNSTYWNTKSYLLMADIFIAQKDYFNAKATLQSVVKNVKVELLKKEALQKLEQVKGLEKGKSKISEG